MRDLMRDVANHCGALVVAVVMLVLNAGPKYLVLQLIIHSIVIRTNTIFCDYNFVTTTLRCE